MPKVTQFCLAFLKLKSYTLEETERSVNSVPGVHGVLSF